MKTLLLFASLLLAQTVFAQNGSINGAKSEVKFTISNAGMEVEGKFTEITGTINFDPTDLPSSKFTATIRVNSIDTKVGMRDDHLKSADYFDIAKYPNMKFESTKVTGSSGNYTVTGNLTIKDVSNTISFPFSTNGTYLTGSFEIDRRDYNVGGNSWIIAMTY